nr:Chain C, VAL-LYS-LEU-GLN-ALA-ILE-PHE-ARG [Severe acute respiratory syndrome coronavirus 2]8GWS_D Chain D, VAL-LYS-LEU-GLN-ALA-ILE-PHE-ARG [Severe acute respiratory syndrome coronavirus 2]
VKLQAIFR